MASRDGWRNWLFGSKDSESYKWLIDEEGLNFYVSPKVYAKIERGEGTPRAQTQHVALGMLAEQGQAEALPNGFVVPSEVAVSFDQETASILSLPPRYAGRMVVEFRGESTRSDFDVLLSCEATPGRMTSSFEHQGPLLTFSSELTFLMTGPQFHVVNGLRQHADNSKSEYENLRLIRTLQEAKAAGCAIDLAHFDRFNLTLPNNITVRVTMDPDGNLILSPNFGQGASADEIENVLGQLRNPDAQSLRVGDEIILLDDIRMAAVHEILTNRKVPKEKVSLFLKNPTAFLDGTLVNLDLGFSLRVHGATRFVQAYFGETDESDIDWFGDDVLPDGVLPIDGVVETIGREEQIQELERVVHDAEETGASEVIFEGKVYDISDTELVERTLARLRQLLDGRTPPGSPNEVVGTGENDLPPVVVDIDLFDDELIDLDAVPAEIDFSGVLYPRDRLCWDHYRRKPYAHQETGVQWIVGLAASQNGYGGSLLADDMGLGKTYMALAAIEQLYRIADKAKNIRKPALVVAPLSVLNNWKEEVEKTFAEIPFRDIVILQSDADLNRFRTGGAEIKNQDLLDGAEAKIRFALKIGAKYLDERLDRDQRLVITTYQTLRDYQFSLCMIDWGFVVFDEAQNIKNPNALQARAAKGLKSDFLLLATGTPVENSLAEFWCLMDTACPKLLGTYQDFRARYIAPINQAAGDEIDLIREKVGIALRERVGAYMLRREKEDELEGLPQKQVFVGLRGTGWEYAEGLESMMDGVQLDAYNQAIRSYSTASKKSALATLQSLRDLSLHPGLRSAESFVVPEKSQALRPALQESGKLDSLLGVLDEIRARGEKGIIFVVNKRLQRYLSVALGNIYGLGQIGVVNGDTKTTAKSKKTETRLSLIQKFEDREGFNLIIMSPIAAGVGLTIVGANNVIHLERHWNPAKEAQATDRVYRIGQKRDVNIYVPILRHPEFESFDVNLHGLLSKKTLLRNAIVVAGQVVPEPGGLGTFPGSPDAPMTVEDILGLSWEQFEAFCAEFFKSHFEADDCWLTSKGADYGADVVLGHHDGICIIQCKHTPRALYDGYQAIQQVAGAATRYENLLNKPSKRLVLATSARLLSQRSRKMAVEYGVEIFGTTEFGGLMESNPVCFAQVLSRLSRPRLDAAV